MITILVPALKVIKTRPRLPVAQRPIKGTFPWVPQFDGLKRFAQEETVKGGLIPATGAQQFTGFLKVPADGVYGFALTTKGKAIVRLPRRFVDQC